MILIDKMRVTIRNFSTYEWKSTRKTLFVVFFIAILSLFLHFREVRIDHLEMGTVAEKYVLAQVGFNFEDLETTRILREESLRDIGTIYYLDEEEIFKGESQIQHDLIHNSSWRELFPSLTFDDLMQANDAIRDTLLKVEFTDVRTFEKLALMGVKSAIFLPCSEGFGDEQVMDSVWGQVELATFPTSMVEASRFMLEKYRDYAWNFKEDFNLRYHLRGLIKERTPIRMTRVEAGSRIINAGDQVTPRHIYMLQQMKKVLTEEQHSLKRPLMILGNIFFSTLLVLMGLVYFHRFYPDVFKSFSKMSLIATVVLLTLCLAKMTDCFMLQQLGLVDVCRLPVYLLFASVLLSILIDRTVALVVTGFIAIVLNITLAMETQDFLIMNLSTALWGIIWTKGVRKRKDIFTICMKIWLSLVPVVIMLNLLKNQLFNRQFFYDCATTFIFVFVVAILIISILPLLESLFGIVTDMTLLELADPNHPLLRRLSLGAPGTYQHALSVAHLAEEAALAIGANAVLCRVGALYHDIGKAIQPAYFVENRGDGVDMHQLLTPLESAQVIIQHVTEGAKLAEYGHLPKPIIDIIREHHGTTLVYYFYRIQMEQSRSRSLGEEEVFFRYPGPTPQSRESAIVMIADSIEATFRAHGEVNDKMIFGIIEKTVAEKMNEHQLDASGLTFDDLEAIKQAIFRSLAAICHVVRPNYPTKPPKQAIPSFEKALV